MNVIVTDTGFNMAATPVHWAPPEKGGAAILLQPDTDPAILAELLTGVEIIGIAFPKFDDGRGFTLARLLRLSGYQGKLRATGHVLADQYAMARRAGFDEVEISATLALRQPEADWLARSSWQKGDYQGRLRRNANI